MCVWYVHAIACAWTLEDNFLELFFLCTMGSRDLHKHFYLLSILLSMFNLFSVCLQLFVKTFLWELLWNSSLISIMVFMFFLSCLRSEFETFLILGMIRNFQLKSKTVSFDWKGSGSSSNLESYQAFSSHCSLWRWTSLLIAAQVCVDSSLDLVRHLPSGMGKAAWQHRIFSGLCWERWGWSTVSFVVLGLIRAIFIETLLCF